MSEEESLSNYYEVLGCSRESSYDNLKQAYHELALRHHPDKNSANGGDKTVATEFHRIDEAWKVLRHPDSRKEYDIELRRAELEEQSQLVYARIKPEELENTNDPETLSYMCRCGSSYLVNVDDIAEKNNVVHVYCEECTFMIIVET